jgi:hypothetical protein
MVAFGVLTAGRRPLELEQAEFGKRQKPRIVARCNPMAETARYSALDANAMERLNAVLADQHGEVPSFLG